MLDARTSKESVSVENFETANHGSELDHVNQRTQAQALDQDSDHLQPQEAHTRRPQKKMMTEDEIVGQAFVFLLAGYETSSNTLAFTCYLLAIHPECQRKIQEEVDEFFTRHVSHFLILFIYSHYSRTDGGFITMKRQIHCTQVFFSFSCLILLLNNH